MQGAEKPIKKRKVRNTRKEKLFLEKKVLQNPNVGFGPFYWSCKPGKIVNKFTGEEFESEVFSEVDNVPSKNEWLMTLHETIVGAINTLNNKTRNYPEQTITTIISSPDVLKLLSTMDFYKKTTDSEMDKRIAKHVAFVHAKYEGVLSGRYFVFSSRYLKEPQIAVVCQKYNPNGENLEQKADNEVVSWGLIKVLDLGSK